MVPGSPERKSKGAETGLVRLSVQGPVATSGCTLGAHLGARLNVQSQFCTTTFAFFPFFIQNLQFWSPNTQICFQSLFTSMYSKGLSKTYQTWNQMLFQHNSPIRPIFTKPSTTTQLIYNNFSHNSYPSQDMGLSTTTTTYNHVFNHNSTTSCHNPSIEHNSSIIQIHISWTCKFIINHSIINKLTYPNISLTLEYEFRQVGSW